MAVPPHCAVCNRFADAASGDFALVTFAGAEAVDEADARRAREAAMSSDARPEPPGWQIQPAVRYWFCPDHEASARALTDLPLRDAVEILRERDRDGGHRRQAAHRWWPFGRASRR